MSSAIKWDKERQHKSEFIIRSPFAEDAVAITRLARALAEYEGISSRVIAADITMLLSLPEFYFFRVVETEGRLAGFIFAYPGYDLSSASHGYHLADIFVSETYRGKGIGTALMDELTSQVLSVGGKWISWTLLETNEDALQFYQKTGAQSMRVRFMAKSV